MKNSPVKHAANLTISMFLHFIIIVCLIVGGWIAFNIATGNTKVIVISPTGVTVQDVKTDPEFVRQTLDEVGATDVTFTITDSEMNCGLETARQMELTSTPGGGCFRSDTPNHIYLSENLLSSVATKTLILHEYAHVVQFNEGVEFAELIDAECDADRRAYNDYNADQSYLPYESTGQCR